MNAITQETYAMMSSESLITMAMDGTPLEMELARRLDDYRKAVEKVCSQEPPTHKLDADGTPMFLMARAI